MKCLKEADIKNVRIDDFYWNQYAQLVDDVILDYQWELMHDRVEGAEKSYCIQNFEIAAGLKEGEHKGAVFQDTDLAKWLEAASYALAKKDNPALEKKVDSAISLLAQAQEKDGYLNTYYTITGKKRWSNLFENHELYTAGHFIEAAVAHYSATGKKTLLDLMVKFADLIAEVFGKGEKQLHGYPGHPEIELALVRLYKVTANKKYLDLAYFFVLERGKKPVYFETEETYRAKQFRIPGFNDFGLDYCQAHLPLRKQKTAEGHVVRALYLYTAMADLAYAYEDMELLEQCKELWQNIVQKRMYLTGSVGQAAYGERFTTDYDLPNNSNYSESCASIALIFFSYRLFRITGDACYMDVVEQVFYNTLLSGLSLDGQHFFYVNPLESVPKIMHKNPTFRHIATVRQRWFNCACCPPNIARTLASMGQYLYSRSDNTIYINMFISNEATLVLDSGQVHLDLKAHYPDTEQIEIRVSPEKANQSFRLAIRKPHYVPSFTISINNEDVTYQEDKGYIFIERCWDREDQITINYPLPFRFVYANPKVRDDAHRVALMKGPRVYCLEEIDNGDYLANLKVNPKQDVRIIEGKGIWEGISLAGLKAKSISLTEGTSDKLYYDSSDAFSIEDKDITLVPYASWNNRAEGEMLVWMAED